VVPAGRGRDERSTRTRKATNVAEVERLVVDVRIVVDDR
jgi:hypothetical protein